MEDTDTLNQATAGGYGPFLFAVASGEVGLVSDMLSRRVVFNVMTERKENALHIATKLGRIAMVDKLLHRDLCDPEDRDINNLRPIECAILNSDQKTLEVFVKHSVHPDEECLKLAHGCIVKREIGSYDVSWGIKNGKKSISVRVEKIQ